MTRGFLYEIGTAQELRQYVIQQDRVIIGRGADCDVRLQDTTVSRHHAVITAAGHCRIADLGGANVTKLNGRLIGREPVLLADEPFDGLDIRQSREVAATLRAHASRG